MTTLFASDTLYMNNQRQLLALEEEKIVTPAPDNVRNGLLENVNSTI